MEITEQMKAYAEKQNVIIVNNTYLGVTIKDEFFPIQNLIPLNTYENLVDEVNTAKLEIKNALRKRRFMYQFMKEALLTGVYVDWTCDQFCYSNELMFIDIVTARMKQYNYGSLPNQREFNQFEVGIRFLLNEFMNKK